MRRWYSQRLSRVASSMRTCTWVSIFPLGRREVQGRREISWRFCSTVSGRSGMFTVNPSAMAAATEKTKSPTHAIGK